MRNIVFIVALVIIIAIIVWWVTSDNFTAAVENGVISYNQDSNAFSRFFFKLDCALVRNGTYDAGSLTCTISE